MKTTYCPICHLEVDGGHERDGTYKCWGHDPPHPPDCRCAECALAELKQLEADEAAANR